MHRELLWSYFFVDCGSSQKSVCDCGWIKTSDSLVVIKQSAESILFSSTPANPSSLSLNLHTCLLVPNPIP